MFINLSSKSSNSSISFPQYPSTFTIKDRRRRSEARLSGNISRINLLASSLLKIFPNSERLSIQSSTIGPRHFIPANQLQLPPYFLEWVLELGTAPEIGNVLLASVFCSLMPNMPSLFLFHLSINIISVSRAEGRKRVVKNVYKNNILLLLSFLRFFSLPVVMMVCVVKT